MLNCPVCRSPDCTPSPNKFLKNSLLKCRKCGLIFVYPLPTPFELEQIYSKNYFENNNSNQGGYKNYFKDKENIIKTFEKRLKKIERFYPDKGAVLDVGCATGFFLEVAKKHGFEPYGVEISEHANSIAKKTFGQKIFRGTLTQANLKNNFFSLITMWDYIEHVSEPEKEINLAKNMLLKNGFLVLSTPDAGSLHHKIFKQKWMAYKNEHLYYFSKTNLTILLQKNGFKVIKKEGAGKYISASIFVERLSIYSKFLAKIISFLLSKTGLANSSFYLNSMDTLIIYAQKIVD